MISVLTGDIENSGENLDQPWLARLKQILAQYGASPADWEVYRGDEFQLRLPPENALEAAVRLKSAIKTLKGMDVRISIGIGGESHPAPRISEANGSAYIHSGRQFSALKKAKVKMAVATGREDWDRAMNLILKLGSDFMDDWSQVSAEFVYLALTHPSASQQDLADKLRIQQSAISQRQKRSRWPLVLEILSFYKNQLAKLKA